MCLTTGSGKSQEGDTDDQGVVEPQPLTQVIEPNTKLNLSLPTQTRQKLPIKKSRSDKFGTVSDPTALPPLKKKRTHLEAPVSPSLSSQ